MSNASTSRLAFFFTCMSVAMTTIVAACGDETPSEASTADAGTDGASTKKDGSAPAESDDSGTTPSDKDAAADAKPGKDGPGGDGAACGFNRDCQAALRCECDDATGCACKPGARGTGKNGVDTCTSGNDCESSLCVEGPVAGESICSDECTDSSDCGGKLPKCIEISGIPAPFCARETPK